MAMDPRRPVEYTLELSADRSSLKDVVKGVLHTIFFHRYFTPLYPATHDVLDLTLPFVTDDDVETLIETRTTTLLRHLDHAPTSPPSYSSGGKPSRAQIIVQFLEKKRRKGWFAKADEETVWENWVVEVTLTTARSEPEAARNRRRMEGELQKACMRVVTLVNRERGHIPPITTNESNPFPYKILVNPRDDGWGQKMGIF